jgi:hypothetical protein
MDRDAESEHYYSREAARAGPDARRAEWNQHLAWIHRHVIGPPKPTPHYTVEELRKIGFVGLYARKHPHHA